MQTILDKVPGDVEVEVGAERPVTESHSQTTPGKEEILYNLLFTGKIDMEEYNFLMKKNIEPSVG